MLLPGVNRSYSLTIYNASASQYGQTVGLIWWSIGIILAVIYFIFTYRTFWGKVHVSSAGGYE
jgi:cytochrome d ubiquinol oxidase subunit II